MSVAKRLKSLRMKKNLSVADLASKAQVPVSSYQEWEQGRQIRDVSVYLRLARALEIPLTELLTGKSGSEEWREITSAFSECLSRLNELNARLKSFDCDRNAGADLPIRKNQI